MVMSPPYAPVSPYPLLTKEEEADWLKREAEAIKAELNEVEARIRDLETSK
jgi:prefoldin subunit 5